MMKMIRLAAVFLTAIVGGLGCASQQIQETANLPFSVAVMPIEATPRSDLANESEAETLQISLDLDEDTISKAVAESFTQHGFTRAILLPYPDGITRETFLGWPEAKQSQWWVDSAKDAKADLILECNLAYSPTVSTERNDKFWPNFVLFSIGGPFNMFTNDRSYLVKADLRASLFDLNPIYTERSDLFDRQSLLVALQSETDEVTLDFTDRAEDAGDYALGLILPSSFLATENPTVDARVESEVVRGLCLDLGKRLIAEARDVVTAERLVSFFLDPQSVSVVRESASQVRLSAELVLLKGDAEALGEYKIDAGETSVTGSFEEGIDDATLSTRRDRYLRFPLEQVIATDSTIEVIRLTVWDDSRDRKSRSFTFPIQGSQPELTASR